MWVDGWGHLPGQLIVVSGPSGCGKSTVIDRALANPRTSAQLSVSSTTRAPRAGEQDGVNYHFVPDEHFRAAIERGEFLEHAEYNGNLYGTPAEPVYRALSDGKCVLLEIEVKGAMQVREHAPGALFVFIKAPTFAALEQRLRARGSEIEASLLRRLRIARSELDKAHCYDIILVNDDLDRCVEEFTTLLISYGCGG